MTTHLSKFTRTLAILVACSAFLVAECRADPALDEGLTRLAAKVAEFVRREANSPAIIVGDFIAPPIFKASGGPGLSMQLSTALKKNGVEVRDNAPFQIMGEFSLKGQRENPGDSFDSMVLRIRAKVLDQQGDELQAFAISVFGNSAAQMGGVTADLKPSSSAADQQKEIKNRVENPQAAIVGNETRSSSSSPYGLEIMVREGPELMRRTPTLAAGRSFVPLDRGHRYTVRLHNHSDIEAAVELTIDGLSMFAFSKEGNFSSRVVVKPNSHADIPGWYMTKDESGSFVITGYPESAAGKRGVTTSVGTITATFCACWDPSKAPPDDEVNPRSADNATGIGEAIEKKYTQVNRVVGRPRSVVSVRYNRPQ